MFVFFRFISFFYFLEGVMRERREIWIIILMMFYLEKYKVKGKSSYF